jgi:hypothetical protein
MLLAPGPASQRDSSDSRYQPIKWSRALTAHTPLLARLFRTGSHVSMSPELPAPSPGPLRSAICPYFWPLNHQAARAQCSGQHPPEREEGAEMGSHFAVPTPLRCLRGGRPS